jgi:Ca2+-transporting ATPase
MRDSHAPPDSAEPWHALPTERVLELLQSTPDGISDAEAARRRARVGANELRPAPVESAWRILARQFRSLVVLLLAVAAVASLALGEPLDAAAIAVVLVINVTLGFVTELRARRAMHALLRLEVARASVVRDGERSDMDARELVPGDVIEVEAGQVIPADARLLDAAELRVVEAALTGESQPGSKRARQDVPMDAPLPERVTMLYKATSAAVGHGRAVVTGTGMQTEVGRIGQLVSEIADERTPLERRLDELGRQLIWLALGVAAVVAALRWRQGAPLLEVIETGLALAIAAVPEGLPAVVTIAMAVGVRRMARRRALVRRLPAVETLGAVTVICTDKTGTLTAGQTTVTTYVADGRRVLVTGSGLAPDGTFVDAATSAPASIDGSLAEALTIGVLCNRADVTQEDDDWVARGDPTETALIVAARKAGIERDALLDDYPEVAELPFSSERKLMATFHRDHAGTLVAMVKGAPGSVLSLCTRLRDGSGDIPLDEDRQSALLARNEELARAGLRVLALATGPVTLTDASSLIGLTMVGLVGMEDPPAAGVEATVRRFRDAGIHTLMLTGDQLVTAEAVACAVGVLEPGGASLDARSLSKLDDGELLARLATVRVLSRVSPEDKLRVVGALQRRGEIVAMLGDGVNDAAALRKADIGVAMGGRGTDVAKEAADVVLQDDRFETIGAAVEEGRVVAANIRKFVFYLFSCNLAEVLVLLVAGVVGLPAPLLPLQVLWLNIITDTFPALALALEPAEPELMRRPPRSPAARLLSADTLRAVGVYAALIMLVTLAALVIGLANRAHAADAVTMSFTTLALAQVFHLGNARSRSPVVQPGRVLRNPYALGAAVVTLLLQFLAVAWRPLGTVLGTRPLDATEWIIVVLLAAVPAVAGQLWKQVTSRRERTVPG